MHPYMIHTTRSTFTPAAHSLPGTQLPDQWSHFNGPTPSHPTPLIRPGLTDRRDAPATASTANRCGPRPNCGLERRRLHALPSGEPRVQSVHVRSCQVRSGQVTSRHVTSRHVTSRHVTPCHVTSTRVQGSSKPPPCGMHAYMKTRHVHACMRMCEEARASSTPHVHLRVASPQATSRARQLREAPMQPEGAPGLGRRGRRVWSGGGRGGGRGGGWGRGRS